MRRPRNNGHAQRKAFRAFSVQGNVGQPFAAEWHSKDKVLGPMGMNCGMRD
jgi:hypothetical protein